MWAIKNLINHIYNKILNRNWFSAHNHLAVQIETSDYNLLQLDTVPVIGYLSSAKSRSSSVEKGLHLMPLSLIFYGAMKNPIDSSIE